jgi:hypothetical protein
LEYYLLIAVVGNKAMKIAIANAAEFGLGTFTLGNSGHPVAA